MHHYGGNGNNRRGMRGHPHRRTSPLGWGHDTLVLRAVDGADDDGRCASIHQMKISVLFFGGLKELIGLSCESIDLPEGTSVRELLFLYARREPRFEAMMSSLAIAVNQEYSGVQRPLRDGDEVGLLPPVSGGSSAEKPAEKPVEKPTERMADGSVEKTAKAASGEVRIVRERIDATALAEGLKRSEDGAAVIFDGVVRDNTRGRRTLYLDYEAYEPMALQQMKSLAAQARERFAVRAATIVHRLGRLEIGETSVLIVVAAAHRGPAFEACRWIIDTLKKTVPIWKKEYFEDGAIWADGEPFPEEIRHPGGTAGGTPHHNE